MDTKTYTLAQRIGYARASNTGTDIDSQIKMLKTAKCDCVFSEIASGFVNKKKIQHGESQPQLAIALKMLRPGDTFIVCSLKRIGRRAKDILSLLNDFKKRNISFISLKEQFDTTTPSGDFCLRMFVQIAELDKHVISEGTKKGLMRAKLAGRIIGNKDKLSSSQAKQLVERLDNPQRTESVKEIAESFNISRQTAYNYVEKYRKKQIQQKLF